MHCGSPVPTKWPRCRRRRFWCDRYWKIQTRPRAFQPRSQGHPGAASEAKPRPKTSAEATGQVESADRWATPSASSRKTRGRSQGIEAQLPAAKNKAYGAGNRALRLGTRPTRSRPRRCHNRGMKSSRAPTRMPPRSSPQQGRPRGLRFIAIEDYQAAAKIFGRRPSAIPSGMPKKEKKEARPEAVSPGRANVSVRCSAC